jgi:catechol 2,3-dioxygenase-like lactoylglutathione lyase family enzyme
MMGRLATVTKVSAVTIRVSSMKRSFRFYHDVLGLKLVYGNENASFTSFDVNGTFVNLQLSKQCETTWGRIILYCDDVDEMHRQLKRELKTVPEPEDGPWGERFFHINDPDGHELSIAKPLRK